MTINPSGINAATVRVEPEGGYLPAKMILEAQRAGQRRYAAQLDLREAFMTMLLGRKTRSSAGCRACRL